MDYQYIMVAIEANILTITINREKKMNALNTDLLGEIKQVLKHHQNNAEVKGVILTGAGEKAFAAGADIGQFTHFDAEKAVVMAKNGHAIMRYIETYPKPIIAAVNGFALGGGCELAMACHLRVASENAKFGQPEVNLGIIPGYGGTQRLIQLIGKTKAFELLMTASMISAAEALQLGLVNYVVPQENLLEKCRALLQKIGKKGPLAITKVIECVDAYFTAGLDGFQTEVEKFGETFQSEEVKEGVTAFLEKRKPSF